MTYRTPSYLLENQARSAALSSPNAAALGFELENAVNGRLGAPARFDASSSSHELRFDLGAPASTPIDRAVLAEGHNLAGAQVELRSDPSGFGGPGTLRATVAPTADEVLDFAVASPSSDRFWWFDFVGSGTWSIPEVVLGTRETPVRAYVVPWEDAPDPQVDVRGFPSGLAATRLGPQLQAFALETSILTASDLATYDRLLTRAHTKEVLAFWPPDAADPVRFVQVESRNIRRRQVSRAPLTTGTFYQVAVRLRQVRAS